MTGRWSDARAGPTRASVGTSPREKIQSRRRNGGLRPGQVNPGPDPASICPSRKPAATSIAARAPRRSLGLFDERDAALVAATLELGLEEGAHDGVGLLGLEAPAVMCAEANWWQCHRRLVADALLVRGWTVEHLAPDGRRIPHELPEFAQVEGIRVSYPALSLM